MSLYLGHKKAYMEKEQITQWRHDMDYKVAAIINDGSNTIQPTVEEVNEGKFRNIWIH